MYQPDQREFNYMGDDYVAQPFARRCRCNSFIVRSVDLTEVPDTFREADISKFDFNAYGVDTTKLKEIIMSFFNDYKRWKASGKGLYLFSKTTGSGKTFLACCLAKSVMMKYGLTMRFTTAPGYIDKVSEGYTLSKQGISDNPSDVFRECDLLILDDLGVQLSNDWQNQELFKLVNDRVNKGLVTIYTSNLDISKVNVDERIRSRIYGTSIALQMPEESVRTKKANDAQKDFLKGVLG